jgi:hypothetical protein
VPGVEILSAFLQQASAKGTKATVLKPLGWIIAILIAATIGSASLSSSKWILTMFAIFVGITILLYLFTYLFCLFTDKDSLRSETYSIQKLAIQKGLIGDNMSGIISGEATSPSGLLDQKTPKAKEGVE